MSTTRRSREQIALAHKEVESYDPSCYETQLVRAAESFSLSAWAGPTDIQRELSEGRVPELADFKGRSNERLSFKESLTIPPPVIEV